MYTMAIDLKSRRLAPFVVKVPMQLQSILAARKVVALARRITLPAGRARAAPRSKLGDNPPRLWGFYRHRRCGYITQVVAWVPHKGVGFLVQVHHFHRQFPRTMTFNPRLFERLFDAVDL